MFAKGFTIVELVVVLIIISFMIFSITLSPQPNTLSLKAEAQLLTSQLRRLQYQAISGNKRTKITFSSQSYSLRDITYNQDILDLRTGQNIISLPSGQTLSTSGLPNSYIVFDSQGIPYVDEISTPLTQAAIITISESGNQFQVEIRPRTGKVKVL